jgi:hypothetical protein
MGDFGESTVASTTGQIVSYFVPVVGQLAAGRDLVASVKGMWDGKEGAGRDVMLAAAGFLPGGVLGKLANNRAFAVRGPLSGPGAIGAEHAGAGVAKAEHAEVLESAVSKAHRDGDSVVK